MRAESGQWLLRLARHSIETALTGEWPRLQSIPAELEPAGASFVTLTRKGMLRGCIGSLEAHQPLWRDVMLNARAAALNDPRFPPVTLAELADTSISLSLLSPAESLPRGNREALKDQLTPGVHGLTISAEGHCATFLPSVWDQLPGADDFLDQLKAKAGLAPTFPEERLACERYTVEYLSESMPEQRR